MSGVNTNFSIYIDNPFLPATNGNNTITLTYYTSKNITAGGTVCFSMAEPSTTKNGDILLLNCNIADTITSGILEMKFNATANGGGFVYSCMNITTLSPPVPVPVSPVVAPIAPPSIPTVYITSAAYSDAACTQYISVRIASQPCSISQYTASAPCTTLDGVVYVRYGFCTTAIPNGTYVSCSILQSNQYLIYHNVHLQYPP